MSIKLAIVLDREEETEALQQASTEQGWDLNEHEIGMALEDYALMLALQLNRGAEGDDDISVAVGDEYQLEYDNDEYAESENGIPERVFSGVVEWTQSQREVVDDRGMFWERAREHAEDRLAHV